MFLDLGTVCVSIYLFAVDKVAFFFRMLGAFDKPTLRKEEVTRVSVGLFDLLPAIRWAPPRDREFFYIYLITTNLSCNVSSRRSLVTYGYISLANL